MFEETLYQSTEEGVPFVKVLESEGILPGVKVDKVSLSLLTPFSFFSSTSKTLSLSRKSPFRAWLLWQALRVNQLQVVWMVCRNAALLIFSKGHALPSGVQL